MKKFIVLMLLALSNVAMAGIKQAGWGLDGSWMTHDGQGIDVKYVQRANGDEDIIAYWFTYDQAGTKQAWLYLDGDITGNRADFVAYAVTGGQFNSLNPLVGKSIVGSVAITLTDCSAASMSWSLNAPQLGITSTGMTPALTRLSPLSQNNGKILCSGEASGLAKSDDTTQHIPLIGGNRVMVLNKDTRAIMVNENAHAQGAYLELSSNLDSCADYSYSASCFAGSPSVSVTTTVNRSCIERKAHARLVGNTIAVSDTFFGYLTDNRVRVQRASDGVMISDETATIGSSVEVSNTVAAVITSNLIRVFNKDGVKLKEAPRNNGNARIAVSDTMYAFISDNNFQVYRVKDGVKVFEVGVDSDPMPIIKLTNSRAYYFGTRTGGWVVNYDGTWVTRN